VKTDVSEKGLETIIMLALTGAPPPGEAGAGVAEAPAPYAARGRIQGDAHDYDRNYAVDLAQLTAFIRATQEPLVEALSLEDDGPVRQKFLARLQGEVTKRGVIDVLRHGVRHGPHDVTLYYPQPSAGNAKAAAQFAANRLSLTRQLRYSTDIENSLDIGAFVNGLPFATFELKNSFTKQTVEDAVEQYKRDRDPRELLFMFGRCAVHFAVDDQRVMFCTELKGKASWFLPFDRGWNDGAGNPPNPDGLKTSYLWEQVLEARSLADIIENYATIVEEKNDRTGKKEQRQIWPRYHQLDVVRKLLADAGANGAGRRYLIQHSAGSGKSNSIAWLAHQMIGLRRNDQPVFDSIIVVTDRRVLDTQIQNTIKQFAQVRSTVEHADRSGDLRRYIEAGKKIIISTVQKFPVILDDIGNDHRGRTFAIVIDEAHSSQGGKTTAAMGGVLGAGGVEEDDETAEDRVNRAMEARKLLPNASYFAFTATPKNKTLEIFGEPFEEGGVVKHRPFHSYTMKQAIQEGFILDVLKNYTPYSSYYRLIKTVDADPEFDVNRARKRLRRYVESNPHAILAKARIMVEHFEQQVIALQKIGGEARAMVVTSGVGRAIEYFFAFREALAERRSPHRAIVAFSGEHDWKGEKVTEVSLNGFPSSHIVDKIRETPYRFLICADKFQTGYDEPLLHTMYVDKPLSGIKAVQTLSRLNRAHQKKHDTFVLDFINDVETIEAAFADYYRTTILSEETDPNKLWDLKAALDGYEVYTPDDLDELTALYLGGAPRAQLDPLLDVSVAAYIERLDEDGQVDFKGKAKAFTRTYHFLASILAYTNADWEKLATYLDFLVPRLPAPREDDLSKGILETIDMDSYRVEKQATVEIQLPDEDAEIEPVPTSGGGAKQEAEIDVLSHILATFNEQFGNVEWNDEDRVKRLITEDIANKVQSDTAYENARKNSDKQNARIEMENALRRVMTGVMSDDTQLFKYYSDDPEFRRRLEEAIFRLTYRPQQPLPGGDWAT
jgi:type I restriction enzyme R subunit